MRDDEEEDKMEDIELARKGFDQFQDTVTSFIRSQLSTKREV